MRRCGGMENYKTSAKKSRSVRFEDLRLLEKISLLGGIPLELVEKFNKDVIPVWMDITEYLLYSKKFNFLRSCLMYDIPEEFKETTYSKFVTLFSDSQNFQQNKEFFKKFLNFEDFVVDNLSNRLGIHVKYM